MIIWRENGLAIVRVMASLFSLTIYDSGEKVGVYCYSVIMIRNLKVGAASGHREKMSACR